MAEQTISTDVCIIGSGAAGLSLALALKRSSGKNILVLEGSLVSQRPSSAPRSVELLRRVETTVADNTHRYEDPNAQKLYEGEVSPDVLKLDKGFLTRSRIRVFGGTTNCWGGWTRTLQDADFKKWPIKRADLNEAYEYALYLCSLSADPARPEFPLSAYDDPSWWQGKTNPTVKAIQFKDSDPCRGGVLTVMDRGTGPVDDNGLDFQLRWGPEIFAPGSKAKLRRNANVRRLEFSGGKVRSAVCTSVDDRGKPVEDFRVEAEHFVLAAGGIEVPRLMLLSGFADEHDLIGTGFMIHPLNDWGSPGMTFTPTGSAPPGVTNFHNQDVRFTQGSYRTKARAVLIPSDASLEGDEKLGNFRAMVNFSGPQGTVNFNWEQVPSEVNALTLISATDALGDRRVGLNWTLSDDDKYTVNRAVTLVGETLKRLGYLTKYENKVNFNSLLLGDHHMGTTRMGTSPENGVVDKDCRVFGMDNLYVASSSVFTTGGWSNPTLTIIALAVRLAKLLR